MCNLLLANLARFKKNILFIFSAVVMLILGIFTPISIYSEKIKYLQLQEADKVIGGYVIFVCIIMAFICCIFCGEEYDGGTVRNKLSVGHSRMHIYSAQFFTCIIAGMILCLLYLLPALLLGNILLDAFESSFGLLLLYFVSGILCVCACVSIYCMLMTMIPKRTAGTAFTTFIMLVMIYIANQVHILLIIPAETYQFPVINGVVTQIYGENPHYPTGIYRKFLEIFFDVLPSGQAYQIFFRNPAHFQTAQHLPRMILFSCSIIAISFFAGIR
ncbi:MAG: ABC transporter permease, partial [Oscillospiraceae bacterium]|nr:ABC transporter permease [Oscillospiraceae bacterium]